MNSAGATLTLSGVNTYGGATNVTAGTLTVNGSTAAASTVNVGTAGTLGGTGTINGNATLTGNGIIAFGAGGNIVWDPGRDGRQLEWSGYGRRLGDFQQRNLQHRFRCELDGFLRRECDWGNYFAMDTTSTLTGSLNEPANSTFQGAIAGAANTVTINSAGATPTLSGVNTYTGYHYRHRLARIGRELVDRGGEHRRNVGIAGTAGRQWARSTAMPR